MTRHFPVLPFCFLLLPIFLLTEPRAVLAANDDTLAYKAGLATPAQPVKALYDGFYVGVAGGYDSYRVHQSTNLSFNGDSIAQNPVINPTGFVGGVFGGYGEYFKTLYYLGGEAFVNLSGASVNTSTSSDSVSGTVYQSKVSVGTTFGLSLLPGFKVNESSLFYLRLGYVYGNIESQENLNVSGAYVSTDENSWGGAVNYGLGLETAVYKNFSLRGEYTHTDYNGFTSPFFTRYSSSDNQVMLALIYHVK